jgi:hypothetical protein
MSCSTSDPAIFGIGKPAYSGGLFCTEIAFEAVPFRKAVVLNNFRGLCGITRFMLTGCGIIQANIGQ